ncbi:hypothetical protein [Pseudosulfitobacter sp. DSM 107133]|uniref:hypothetical protein n=1 Tax=Pseudosulfitobacter sp. DSM 107133 TaxID=2883100 RepID=UPI001962690E|nr:hypothetical protein [Pseudosulfitobacter sp. DSM 107133]
MLGCAHSGGDCGQGQRHWLRFWCTSDGFDLYVINGAEVEDRRLVGIAAQVGFEAIPTQCGAITNDRYAETLLTLLSCVPYRRHHDEIVLRIAKLLSPASIAAGKSSLVFRCP